MGGVENAEGQAMRMRAEGYRETLKAVLNDEARVEALRADPKIGDAGLEILSKCEDPENYISMDQKERDTVDTLMLKIESAGAAS